MNDSMNAISLEILIDRYYNPHPYDFEVTEIEGCVSLSESEDDAFKYLKNVGLISYDGSGKNKTDRAENKRAAMITDKGRVHVNALIAAPLPTPIWKSPMSKVSS